MLWRKFSLTYHLTVRTFRPLDGQTRTLSRCETNHDCGFKTNTLSLSEIWFHFVVKVSGIGNWRRNQLQHLHHSVTLSNTCHQLKHTHKHTCSENCPLSIRLASVQCLSIVHDNVKSTHVGCYSRDNSTASYHWQQILCTASDDYIFTCLYSSVRSLHLSSSQPLCTAWQ